VRWDVAIRKQVGDRGAALRARRRIPQRRRAAGPLRAVGAGKTLTLKAIAGLLRPDSGQSTWREPPFRPSAGVDKPARERECGYLFQEYALFPHLTVRQNIAFGGARGWRNPRRLGGGTAVDRWLDALELRPLAERFPDQLSGGQRQRVALARALAGEPRALLLDEPFAALDEPLRNRLRAELAELQARLALPIVLITHDPADVDAFADDVVHIDAGIAVAPPAQFLEEHPMKSSARNQLAGTVSAIIAGAVNDEVELSVGAGQHIVATITHGSTARLGLAVGVPAFALVKASSVVVVAGRRRDCCCRRAISSPAPSSASSRAPSTPRSRSTSAACASSPSSPKRARARSASRRACRRSPSSRRSSVIVGGAALGRGASRRRRARAGGRDVLAQARAAVASMRR
jgi:molybdate transport system ATP-binding protein